MIAVAFCIRGYTLERGHLLVHRGGWNTDIDLRDLLACEAMPSGSFRAIRTFGNGGFFRYDVEEDRWHTLGTHPVAAAARESFMVTPVSTYGVVMFAVWNYERSSVYVYKHAEGQKCCAG